jgi:hypothetical protein
MGCKRACKGRLGLALLTAATATAALPVGAASQTGAPKLPIVAVDAPEGIAKEPKRPATMRLLDGRRRDDYNGPIGIKLHGHSSFTDDPKKSFALETRTKSGKARNVSLLGMPEDEDWALIAGYKDESLLRNHVAYSAARWLGRYAARTRLVEVIVNDSYEGVYLLVEKLKLHDRRVAVDDLGVSGGYLLEATSTERASGREFFTTPVKDQPVVYTDPERDGLSYGRAYWISEYVSRFERRLYSDRLRDRRHGYRRYLDLDAAVDFVLLNELFRNADTFRNSTYMHKSAGEKLALGPLWDFDHALGNDPDPDFNSLTGWQYLSRGSYRWIERLYADPGFCRQMVTRWGELRDKGIVRHIRRTIDSGADRLAAAQERNFSRWPVFRTEAVYPADPRTSAPPANYAEAVDYLKWWVRQRAKWIDKNVNSLHT